MAGTRAFIPNPAFQAQMEASDETRDGLQAFAEDQVAPLARANAEAAGEPWMPRAGHELIEVEVTEDGVYVVNSDWAAHLAEFGSVNNPVIAPLRRAAMAAGLDVDESPED